MSYSKIQNNQLYIQNYQQCINNKQYNCMQDHPPEKAYVLQKKVQCPKHPSKNIEYFCKFPQCTQRLFCSSCLLKKQYCRHQMNQFIVDIAEFMFEQKTMHEMKGLAKQADIFEYLINKQQRRKMYTDQVNSELEKFELELDNIIRSITKTIEQLRENIRNQMTEFNVSYGKMQQTLIKKTHENFSFSYMSKFANFEEMLEKNDVSSLIGLRELLEKLTFESGEQSKVKQIRKIFESLISMNDETPEIDYSRYESIKTYFKVFQNKLSQAGPSLVTLHKTETNQQKEANQNALIDNIPNIPILSIRKIANSANFNTNHTRTVYTMCKLPNKKIATGGDDGFMKIFDISNFECTMSFQAHQSGIRSMIVLPNGNIVTGSYDKTIKIWNSFTPENLSVSQITQVSSQKSSRNNGINPLKVLTGHTSCVIALRYLNDGATIASGSADYTIKIWDLEKGENTKNFTGHMNDVLCFACSSNGANLISGSADRTIKIWSLGKKYSSACLKTLTGHTDFIWTIILLPDDITLFSGGLDKTIKMWDIFTGQLLRTLPNGHTSHITKLSLFSAGIILSSSNDCTLKFWDYKANVCIHTLEGQKSSISTFLISEDNAIMSVGQDKSIYIWD